MKDFTIPVEGEIQFQLNEATAYLCVVVYVMY